MTSKIKCPVCGKTELIRMFNPITGKYFEDYDCPFRLCNFRGNKVAVDALIQAKQDLEIARKAMNQVMSMGAKNNICYHLKAKTVKSILGNALKQIEQKDVK